MKPRDIFIKACNEIAVPFLERGFKSSKNGQILREHTSLRKDKSLLDSFLSIATNRNAKRGRQIFIILLGYKHCAEYAPFFNKAN